MSLAPCPDCQRHIRVSERACPFCGGAVAPSIASKVVPGTTQRLSRAAAFAFTATLSLAGCSDTTPAPTPDAATDTVSPGDTSTPDSTPVDVRTDAPTDMGGPAPAYGAPVDVPSPGDSSADTGPGDGGIAPLYGAPVDAGGQTDVVPVRDNGGVVPLYGAVPPPDADVDDVPSDATRDGSIGVRYGAVPIPDSGA